MKIHWVLDALQELFQVTLYQQKLLEGIHCKVFLHSLAASDI